MGIHIIKMPDIGEGIAEVELVEWHVQPGDEVAEDQLLADVMTDKATVEVPSPVVGKVLSLGGQPGDVMAVGTELIRIEVEGAGNAAAAGHAPESRHDASTGAAGRTAPASITAGSSGDEHVVSQAASAAASGPANTSGAATPVNTPPTQSGALAGQTGGTPASSQASALTSRMNTSTSTASVVTPSASVPTHPTSAAARPAAVASVAASVSKPAEAGVAGPLSVAPSGALRQPGEKPLASPAVRQRAADQGIDLRFVPASGKAGQITQDDLDTYAARGATVVSPAPASGYAERTGEHAVPVIGLRRRIAQKMQEAKRRIPHFSYVEEIDVTELETLRVRLNARFAAQRGKLTLLPFLIRAVVLAVRDFPQINARFDDEAGVVTQYGPVHLGVAAQTEAGLMVPVLRHAETHDLWSCAQQVARLAEEARTGKVSRDEVSGSTITITSLGALGGIVSTPVINHPEVAIVGVNRIVERPVILGGAVVARKMMNLSSSFDHRVVDGMQAAEFIQVVRGYLECPATLFVE